MTPNEISDGYQSIIRQSYPGVIVRPNEDDWMPDRHAYCVYFIPDEAELAYHRECVRDGGIYEQAESRGLPDVPLLATTVSQTKKYYSHLFPEIFGRTTSAKATRTAPKRAKSRSAKARVRSAVASSSR